MTRVSKWRKKSLTNKHHVSLHLDLCNMLIDIQLYLCFFFHFFTINSFECILLQCGRCLIYTLYRKVQRWKKRNFKNKSLRVNKSFLKNTLIFLKRTPIVYVFLFTIKVLIRMPQKLDFPGISMQQKPAYVYTFASCLWRVSFY